MIHDRTIVCIASRWDYDPTSKHHIMRALSQTNEIVWVNYRGSRRPTLSLRDAGAVLTTLKATLGGARRIDDCVTQLTPLVIPGVAGGVLGRLSQRLLVAQIRRVLARI